MRFLIAILLLLVAAPAWAQQSQGMSKALVVSSCGGGALPSGPVTQLTMDTTGRLCQSGIGSNVCSQATAYLARTVGGNEGGNAVKITALICGLVSDGVITGDLVSTGCGKFDVFYLFAQQNATDALLNICGTSNTPSIGGTPTFASYVGYHGFDLGNNYFWTFFAGPGNYTQNNGSFGVWSYAVINQSVIGNNSYQMGDNGSLSSIIDSSGGLFYARIGNSAVSGVATTITKGLFVAERTSSTSVFPYQNGVSGGALSFASSPLSGTFIVGGNFANGTPETLCEAHIGASLGATLNLALYNRLRTYMTAVGVP